MEPQTPPDVTGHWQRPPSRVQTARFTSAGMCRGRSEGCGGAVLGFFTRPLLPVVLREEEVERRLEDGLGVRARVAVRERIARSRELREETLRDGDVEPAQLGGERLDHVGPPHRGG